MSPRALKIALPLAAALGAGTAVAIAAIPSSDGTIHACYSTTGTPTGALRVVDEGQSCATGEQTLTWNQTGPTGPTGPAGPPGDTGTSDTSTGGTDTGTIRTEPGGPSADIFLKLDGIAGDSTDDKHKGEIEVESVAYDIKEPTTAGVPRGKPRFSALRVIKLYDPSSPKLQADAATGRHIKTAVLTFRRSDDPDNVEFLTYRLTDVAVTSYEQGGADVDQKALGSLEDEIGLYPARVQVTERTVDADGKPGPVVTASWVTRRAK